MQAVISEKMDMTPMDMSAMDPAKGLAGMMKSNPENDTMMFGTFGFKVIMNMPMIPRKDGVCLVVRESEDTYYILGNACMIAPFSADPAKPNYDIISLEEGCFENGEWKAGRRLNGDESARLTFDEYGILKLKVFTYE